ncbi:hypothetical protein [Salinirubrum litoreum]|uniref:Uncharacterized protein n=1 Tax=Salinirubrum litoreum TaxID=1126234 RepID=A0ABD5R7R7_9EURY|nr:hypothetical protein [Salinirubrum litoreum]
MSDDAATGTGSRSTGDVGSQSATARDAQSVGPVSDAQTVVVCCDGSADGAPAKSASSSDTDDSVAASDDIEGEDDDTTSTQMRHWLTNDLLAGFLHLTLVAVVLAAGLGALDLSAIPPRMRLVFLGTVLSATVWSFGEDVLQSIRGS